MLLSLCKTQIIRCQYHSPIFSSLPHNPQNHNPSLSNSFPSVSAHTRPRPVSWLARVTEPDVSTIVPEDGPVELLPSVPSIFATTDEPTPLQLATAVLLTGSISVFLVRSLRRRAKRAKELKFRSIGATKSLTEEALDSLKAMKPGSLGDDAPPPKPAQALLGGISAGVIALILYKFTLTVEAGLNRQTLSDNFSVRQITVTVRTIVNGLFYLATFVFGVNSVGLLLYSGQLAINSLMDNPSSEGTENKGEGGLVSSPNAAETTNNSTIESDGIKEETEGSNDTQS